MSMINSFKRLHKWMALLVGIQFILWVVSGIVFSFIDHRIVEGSFIYKDNQKAQIIKANNFAEILNDYPTATEIVQITLLDRSVFKVVFEQQTILLDLQAKKKIIVDEVLVKQVAERDYRGKGKLLQVNFIEKKTDENRAFVLPSWQVIYDDEFGSHIYFSAKTGEYQGIRTDSWRTFDFFMMLHFMDYGQRGNFNHALIVIAAIILVFFSMSGILLIYSSFSRQDFSNIVNKIYQHKDISVTLVDVKGIKKTISTEKNNRLMDALLEQNIQLDSACGGGGVCGLCRVKLIDMKADQEMSDLSEHDLLDEQELKDGYRLACQLSVDKKMEVELPICLDKTVEIGSVSG